MLYNKQKIMVKMRKLFFVLGDNFFENNPLIILNLNEFQ